MSTDFGKMKYRVDKLKSTDNVVLKYPDLAKYSGVFGSNEGLPDGLTYETVMRYICYMYSPGSPLIVEQPDPIKRRTWALRLLNIEPDAKGKYSAEINEMVQLKNASVREKLLLFLRIQKSEDWAIACTMEQQLHLLLGDALVKREDIREAKTLQESIELCRENLVAARERILMGERSVELQEDFQQFLADENLGIRPEEYMINYAKDGTVFPEIVP